MHTADFDFHLPPELIAQQPTAQRDQSRLLVLERANGNIAHRRFRDVLDFFRAGDVLVLNNSRVIRARLRGVNEKTGGAFEMLLLEEIATNDWWAMMKPGKRARLGTRIEIHHASHASRITSPVTATVTATNDEGHRRLHFDGVSNILDALAVLGEIPLPPYISRIGTPSTASARCRDAGELDNERYQTVFAEPAGSVAAPTAGLHFTQPLLDEIRARDVDVQFVTLHVGLGTFAPVKAETLDAHIMHEERYEVSECAAQAVNAAKAAGRRVIAVGTTSVRVLESAARSLSSPKGGEGRGEEAQGFPAQIPSPQPSPRSGGERELAVASQPPVTIRPGSGRTRIFIHPPRDFKIVDALLTNFHLPCSTLLMLVSAFASPGTTRGREMVLSAYAEAIRERYRFFSYGDAMLLL